jgi:L-amino acid N-acyltransferase YncA
MEIREPRPDDQDALLRFFAAIPEDERTFFKEEVLDADTIARWLADERGVRALACEDGEIAGYVAVVPLPGWADHVGEVRLVVAPTHRRAGVGRALARQALTTAIERLQLRKLYVEVVAEQDGAVAMFQALGFTAEGLLRGHVRDRSGEVHDLVLLAHQVDEQWSSMLTAGIDRAVS